MCIDMSATTRTDAACYNFPGNIRTKRNFLPNSPINPIFVISWLILNMTGNIFDKVNKEEDDNDPESPI